MPVALLVAQSLLQGNEACQAVGNLCVLQLYDQTTQASVTAPLQRRYPAVASPCYGAVTAPSQRRYPAVASP